jgi:hypothetical protein
VIGGNVIAASDAARGHDDSSDARPIAATSRVSKADSTTGTVSSFIGNGSVTAKKA